jgi:rhamnosyl/mannosyltransferase
MGGVEIVTKEIAEEAARWGARSTVACFDREYSSESWHEGVRVVRYRARMLGPAPVSWRFIREIKSHVDAADTVVMHYPNPLPELGHLLFGRKRLCRLIVFYHSDLVRYRYAVDRAYWALSRQLVRRADVVVTTSAAYAAGSPVLRSFRDKLAVIPLATDVERFRPHRSAGEPRIPFARRVLFVGRFARFKGLEVLLSSLRKLPSEFGVVLVGDGPGRDMLCRVRDKWGLGERVLMPGAIPNEELSRWYNACDVFALPSTLRSESFGVASLEAMACGLPVVTTDLGTGTTLYNRDGVTGRVVAPGDDIALARAIEECVRRRDEFGRAARAEVERCYSLQVFRSAVADLLELSSAPGLRGAV